MPLDPPDPYRITRVLIGPPRSLPRRGVGMIRSRQGRGAPRLRDDMTNKADAPIAEAQGICLSNLIKAGYGLESNPPHLPPLRRIIIKGRDWRAICQQSTGSYRQFTGNLPALARRDKPSLLCAPLGSPTYY